MIPRRVIRTGVLHPEPLLKIFRKIGFARFAASVKKTSNR